MFFKDILGQEIVKQKLIENARKNRVSHAQLFLGSEGSGKMGLALAYARFLSCKNPGSEDACGKCSSCIKFNKLAHPDVNFFYPIPSKKQGDRSLISKDFISQWREYLTMSPYVSLNNWYNFIGMENKQGIINSDDCNEIIRVLGYKSYESKYKIIIIWMIERLYHAAAPKLLKILEEPPVNTIFLIVSENQDLILNTILSRTQLIKIPRLQDDAIEQGLIQQYKCEPEQARQIAFLAEGNFVRAQQMLKNSEINENNTNLLRDWLRACYKPDIEALVSFIETFAKLGREKQKTFLTFAIEIFRQCTLLNFNAEKLLRTTSSNEDFIRKFSTVLKPEIAPPLTQEFSQAVFHIERNANPKILFTDLSLKTNRILRSVN
ncbi:MAG: ATP-binding protein [Bacteroidales bacterium]